MSCSVLVCFPGNKATKQDLKAEVVPHMPFPEQIIVTLLQVHLIIDFRVPEYSRLR